MKLSSFTLLALSLINHSDAFSVQHDQYSSQSLQPLPSLQQPQYSQDRASLRLGMASMPFDGLSDGLSNEMETSSSSKFSAAAKKVVVDWDWERMADSVFAEDSRPVVLFDGVCNFCNGGVNFAMDMDPQATFRFCSLQTKTAQSLLLRDGRSPDDHTQIILVTSSSEEGKGSCYSGSDAVTRICQGLEGHIGLQWLGWAGQVVLPEGLRESMYQFVSTNRYQFGENESCRIDFDGTFTGRFLSDPVDVSQV